jgi:peptidyl-prolyl cis-trans isomerase C
MTGGAAMSLVTVNRVVIPDEDIHYESARVEERGVDERRGAAARQLVVRELLRQRADEVGLDTESDVDAAVEALLEREIPKPEVDDAACRRYYESNPERFCTPVMAEVRHILLAAPPDDVNARAEAEQRAEALIEEAINGNESVSALAARHSDCPSATDGGHLGAVGRGQTVPEFEDVVLRLEPGLARRPVETRYGFHVVEVVAREGGEPLSYEQVNHLIADYIRERSWRRAVSQYIGQLAADAEIEGVELDVPDSPLVQ